MQFPEYRNLIEYTHIKSPSSKDIKKFIEKAKEEKYYGVCLNYNNINVATKYTDQLKFITVAGFPPISYYNYFKNRKDPRINFFLGMYRSQDIDTIKEIIDDPRVDELDLVFPMYWYAKGELVRIYKFFKGIKKRFKKPVKVITELGTIFRNRTTLFEISDLIEQSGVDFFKTNTGLIPLDFNLLVAGIQEVKDLKPNIRIKASGGIRTLSQVRILQKIGVERIGTSNLTDDSVKIGKDCQHEAIHD